MLFPYKYVPHKMEKMQEFIDFIFYEVWCKAPTKEYSIHLFEPFDPLYQIMSELYRLDLASKLTDGAGQWFYVSVNEIFIEFKKMDDDEIGKYCQSYQANNLIEELCLNIKGSVPVQYRDLNPSKADLNSKLANFLKKLYSSGFFELSFVKKP